MEKKWPLFLTSLQMNTRSPQAQVSAGGRGACRAVLLRRFRILRFVFRFRPFRILLRFIVRILLRFVIRIVFLRIVLRVVFRVFLRIVLRRFRVL